jgi:hypothetical protein
MALVSHFRMPPGGVDPRNSPKFWDRFAEGFRVSLSRFRPSPNTYRFLRGFENNIFGFVLILNIRSFMSNMSDIDTGDEQRTSQNSNSDTMKTEQEIIKTGM